MRGRSETFTRAALILCVPGVTLRALALTLSLYDRNLDTLAFKLYEPGTAALAL